jgi:hypothetical protein
MPSQNAFRFRDLFSVHFRGQLCFALTPGQLCRLAALLQCRDELTGNQRRVAPSAQPPHQAFPLP